MVEGKQLRFNQGPGVDPIRKKKLFRIFKIKPGKIFNLKNTCLGFLPAFFDSSGCDEKVLALLLLAPVKITEDNVPSIIMLFFISVENERNAAKNQAFLKHPVPDLPELHVRFSDGN